MGDQRVGQRGLVGQTGQVDDRLRPGLRDDRLDGRRVRAVGLLVGAATREVDAGDLVAERAQAGPEDGADGAGRPGEEDVQDAGSLDESSSASLSSSESLSSSTSEVAEELGSSGSVYGASSDSS